jgi:hypothetical protein
MAHELHERLHVPITTEDRMRRRGLLKGALLLLLATAGPASALPPATGEPVLTVTGAIGNPNAGDKAVLDQALLEGLGMATIRTTTSWTDGVVEFTGPTVASVLDAVGASGATLHAVAVNDYAVDLDADELRRYGAILAMRQDGKQLSLRDKGPLWVVLPRDRHPELMDEANNSKWIWQLRSIEIR